MNGGGGDDELYIGNGDAVTGGEDQDASVLLDSDDTTVAEITNFNLDEDAMIYVYDAGTPEPALILVDNGDGTQTLAADGIGVAVVAAPSLGVDDVILFERGSDPSVPLLRSRLFRSKLVDSRQGRRDRAALGFGISDLRIRRGAFP